MAGGIILYMAKETSGAWHADDDHERPHSHELGDVYREVCSQLRATDEISLKLLAAVPLASGVGIALVASAENLPGAVSALVSAFAAVVVFAIYCWERKNIATCSHLRRWALALEREYFHVPQLTEAEGEPSTYPHGAVAPPKTLRRAWGKTQAEDLLYRAAIVSWLTLGVYSLVG
jgi:hypothetical protein